MNSLLNIDFSKPGPLITVGVLFALVNALALSLEIYVFALVPLALLAVYLTIYYPRYILLLIVFATPLSVNLENLDALGGIGMYLPTEPLIVLLMLLYLFGVLRGYKERGELLRHPLSIAIIASLGWILITSLTSSMPLVSFKFFLMRFWFVIVFYFFINRFFASEKFIRYFAWLYIAGLTIAVGYTLIHHSQYQFSEQPGHWVMYPFFKDHTSYGAILAMFFPLVLFHFFRAKMLSLQQIFMAGLVVFYIAAIILSYTRAAWVSLAGALGVFILIKLRIDFKLVILAALALVGGYFAFEDTITHQLEKNNQDSSENLGEHVRSITNISSDASNLERINRWNSAVRMFQERPLLGFGPGTYMFQYTTFQKSADRTIISTNQSDGGNAHSEYLGPLSESGLPGAFLIVLIVALSLYKGITLYYKLDHNPYLKGMVLAMVLGLVTYFLHGVLNNYLDTDKASVPIWAFMSAFVAIEIYHLKPGVNYLNRQQSNAVSSK